MQKLRSIHLYLGCIFAPLLLFFALTGICQTFEVHWGFLNRLNTIHAGHTLKSNDGLSSFPMRIFVVFMALSFIVTTLLGVVMAVKFGRSRTSAWWCLAAGGALPLALVLMKLFR